MTLLSTKTKKRLFSTKFRGNRIYPKDIINKPISITNYELTESRHNSGKKLLGIQVEWMGVYYLCMTESYTLIETITTAGKKGLPYKTKIVRKNDGYYYFVRLNNMEIKMLEECSTPF